MFIPEGIKITFTPDLPETLQGYRAPGVPKVYDITRLKEFTTYLDSSGNEHEALITLDSNHASVVGADGIWTVDKTWDAKARWTKTDGTACDAKVGGWWDDAKTKLKLSLVSCGSAFWPSFGPFDFSSADYNVLDTEGRWVVQGVADKSTPKKVCTAATDDSPVPGLYSQILAKTNFHEPRKMCANTSSAPSYSTLDCVATENEATTSAAFCQNSFSFCGCARPIVGSVGGFKIDLAMDVVRPTGETATIRNFKLMQFLWCTAPSNKRFTFAGVPIQLYTEGGAFCDDLVPTMCKLTDISSTYADTCRCILRTEQLKEQFKGMDLPIQCFLSMCDENVDGVYRTAQQQSGCSARICRQAIAVNGNSILSEGYQTLECDGHVYNVDDVNRENIVDDGGDFSGATDGLNKASAGFKFGPEFFVSLGVLVMVLFLLMLWGVNRWVQKRHTEATKKRLEIKLLTQALKQPAAEQFSA